LGEGSRFATRQILDVGGYVSLRFLPSREGCAIDLAMPADAFPGERTPAGGEGAWRCDCGGVCVAVAVAGLMAGCAVCGEGPPPGTLAVSWDGEAAGGRRWLARGELW